MTDRIPDQITDKMQVIGRTIGDAVEPLGFALFVATPGEKPSVAFTSNIPPPAMAALLRLIAAKIDADDLDPLNVAGHA